MAESNARTGREFKEAWNFLKEEAEQCSQFIGKELSGTLATGPDVAAVLPEGGSSRQMITEERENLREAVLREGLLRHPDQTARPTVRLQAGSSS